MKIRSSVSGVQRFFFRPVFLSLSLIQTERGIPEKERKGRSNRDTVAYPADAFPQRNVIKIIIARPEDKLNTIEQFTVKENGIIKAAFAGGLFQRRQKHRRKNALSSGEKNCSKVKEKRRKKEKWLDGCQVQNGENAIRRNRRWGSDQPLISVYFV